MQKLLIVCLMLLLAACGGQGVAVPTTAVAVSVPTSTATVTASVTPPALLLPTATPPSTPILSSVTPTAKPNSPTPVLAYNSYYTSLVPGQYIVYDHGIDDVSYSVVSLDGVFQSLLITGSTTLTGGTFTKNGKRLAFLVDNPSEGKPGLYLYDLATNIISLIPTDRDCYEVAWSPDETKLAAQCRDPFGKIYVISLADEVLTSLSTPSNDNASAEGKLAWSPDGKWIAFQLWFFKDDSRTGVYIVEAACLSKPDTCEISMKGPFLSGDISFAPYLTWSPDSRFLAVEDHDENAIYIIEGASGEVQTVVEPKSLGVLFGLAWSPDGEWLAYGSPSKSNDPFFWGIYLLSPRVGEPVMLTKEGGEVYAWITIPHPFAPDDLYTITDAGADLNLRAEPSLDGEVLRKLQPGDRVTILDGPVEADGYTWWQMQAEDGTVGWAVNIPELYEAMEE